MVYQSVIRCLLMNIGYSCTSKIPRVRQSKNNIIRWCSVVFSTNKKSSSMKINLSGWLWSTSYPFCSRPISSCRYSQHLWQRFMAQVISTDVCTRAHHCWHVFIFPRRSERSLVSRDISIFETIEVWSTCEMMKKREEEKYWNRRRHSDEKARIERSYITYMDICMYAKAIVRRRLETKTLVWCHEWMKWHTKKQIVQDKRTNEEVRVKTFSLLWMRGIGFSSEHVTRRDVYLSKSFRTR